MGLAVSGGPDSLAMLLLFHEVAPRDFCVATVDHGLRPESASEAAMVARLCAERGIPHDTIPIALAKGSAVQERARAGRYRAMADWMRELGLTALVTAHHADDQAETMVMRLNRGAGLRGLAAMRSVSAVPGAPDLPLLRPLLGWRRTELAGIVEVAGIAPALDPSNHDASYERVRVREAMTSSDAFDANGFAASAAHLAQADEAIAWSVDRLWDAAQVAAESVDVAPPKDLPRVLALRLLERVMEHFAVSSPRGGDLVRWLESLDAGGVATLAGIKADGRGGTWRFTLAPKHRSA
ncbi:tRNA lysidine(34) synthetase TilS [Novosphingobium taihuense]|uniref:tRNA(Ile)-lysidine synthase n=1 Tax=Novosphingobium taihuense TaxID=260085 RepID=A0A7W7ACR7_9SPHN|nr:tRNA lysidine(34) synthetase TilS [Novosphingobium taihuense]MBB4614557.1 tRNA(Ile)-lysidine synthase [Novosphingobium taihuense]